MAKDSEANNKPGSEYTQPGSGQVELLTRKQIAENFKLQENAVKDLEKQLRETKNDYLTVFGLFASVVAFIVSDVTLFQAHLKPSEMAGISCYIASSLQLFTLSLRAAFSNEEQSSWRVFNNPAMVLCCLFIVLGSILLIL